MRSLVSPCPSWWQPIGGQQAAITERGSMVWMSPNMKMETGAGGIGKAFTAYVLR